MKQKMLSGRLSYCSVNIIGLLVHKICLACTKLLHRANDRMYSANLFSYMWYNHETGCYEHLRREDGLFPFSPRQYLPPSVRTIRASGKGVDQTASEKTIERDQAMRHLAYAFLLKVKKILCNKKVYKLDDAAVVNFSPTHALHRGIHANEIPFLFSEMDTAEMRTLNEENPVPTLFEVRPFPHPCRNLLSCLVRPLSTTQLPVLPLREL